VTLDELPGYLRMLAARAGEAAIPASDAMSEAFGKEVKRRLTALSHDRGTRTPAPAGGPPAMESGDLAGSVQQVPASTPVVATSSVAPHMSPRDWVQEWGLDNIRPARAPRMVFVYGDLYRARRVDVPERSYMRSISWWPTAA
jgi:hypothetical protein